MVRSAVRLAVPPAATALTERFAAIRAALGVPAEFPPEVLDAAAVAADAGTSVAADAPAAAAEPAGLTDLTDLPFVTVDPPGSMDLDQAMHLSRDGEGFLVDYAIADVPAFVDPAGPVAAEALRRGQTLYSPDIRTPLHPPSISEDAASLLPDADRRAFVWRFALDARGEVRDVDLVRATVRSRRRLDYAEVQAAADGEGSDAGVAGLATVLQEIGVRRQALERERGGASLPRPDQEVVADGGGFRLDLRPPLPAEDWNAQLSLMTGMAAAAMMRKAGVGVLRTLPEPDDDAMGWFRRQARALGVPWPAEVPYGAFLQSLDAKQPQHLALLHAASALFRGAAYVAFEGEPPPGSGHAAVAAPYAHVTAPLRRLVDRYGLAVCHAVQRGEPVPSWVRDGLPLLPAAMAASDRVAGEVERRCVNTVEAALLAGRVGETFQAVVLDADKDGDGGQVQLLEPLVLARCAGPLKAGRTVEVRLLAADVEAGTVSFACVT
jgi:exoribonuclease R